MVQGCSTCYVPVTDSEIGDSDADDKLDIGVCGLWIQGVGAKYGDEYIAAVLSLAMVWCRCLPLLALVLA